MEVINRFGRGNMLSVDEMIARENMQGRPMIYAESAACLSVTSDIWSWVSEKKNTDRVIMVSNNIPGNNNVIIVLGCQVTDLAILNDIRLIEKLHNENPGASVYVGGCLAYRFDVDLPSYVTRLATMREINTPIDEQRANYVKWQKPFWVNENNWVESDGLDTCEGRLFRNMYPIKIGAGCHGKCSYCTIRDTRGDRYEVDAYMQVEEFIKAEDVVLVSDSPTKQQILDWCHLSQRYNKPISIRNIEPSIAVQCGDELIGLAKMGLLKIFHCPIQSNNPEVLKLMHRSVNDTMLAIDLMQDLRINGVIVATNVIVDYVDSNGKGYKNIDETWMAENFDYWSWNPYFDGKWDRESAENRFRNYLLGD